MEMTLVNFGYENEMYQHCLNIRYEVLRKPLGMEITTEDRTKDVDSLHILLLVDGEPAGTVSLRGNTLRQMAVLEKFRGQGLGEKLVRELERLARQREISEVHLESRNVAISFYEKLGYQGYGNYYDKVGMPHQMMMKKVIAN